MSPKLDAIKKGLEEAALSNRRNEENVKGLRETLKAVPGLVVSDTAKYLNPDGQLFKAIEKIIEGPIHGKLTELYRSINCELRAQIKELCDAMPVKEHVQKEVEEAVSAMEHRLAVAGVVDDLPDAMEASEGTPGGPEETEGANTVEVSPPAAHAQLPQQPGMMPQQPGMMPQQPGMMSRSVPRI